MAMLVTTSELTVTKCWCGLEHAVPKSLYDELVRQRDERNQKMSCYCPLGHTWVVSGTSKLKEAEDQLARERAAHDQRVASLKDALTRAKNQATANKAAKTRLKNRIANGVCPCCTRSFSNLARHMEHMHPDFKKEKGAE